MQHLIDELTPDHYKFLENDQDPESVVCVGLTQPPYEGVIIQYGEMAINEPEEEDAEATLSFTYKVVESPIEEGLLDDAFNEYLGAILHLIIEQSLGAAKENEESLIGSKNRDNDSEESDSQ